MKHLKDCLKDCLKNRLKDPPQDILLFTPALPVAVLLALFLGGRG